MMNKKFDRLNWFLLSMVACITIAVISFNGFFFSSQSSKSKPTDVTRKSGVDSSGRSFDWNAISTPHLLACGNRIEAAIPTHFEPLIDLLNRARNRVPEFSKSALSFSSKWRLALDYIPFTDGQRSPEFLNHAFQTQVLSPDDLEKAIFEVIESYLKEVRTAENQMLLDIRADLDDFPSVNFTEWKDDAALQARFEHAVSIALASSTHDLQSSVSGQLVSLVAGEVLAQVAVRMGVSAGILGAGAASGWATFGIGVVAGVIIDQIVTQVWAFANDPQKELTLEIQKQIDSLQQLLCDGDEQVKGLKQHFYRIGEERSQLRRNAIESLFTNSTDTRATP